MKKAKTKCKLSDEEYCSSIILKYLFIINNLSKTGPDRELFFFSTACFSFLRIWEQRLLVPLIIREITMRIEPFENKIVIFDKLFVTNKYFSCNEHFRLFPEGNVGQILLNKSTSHFLKSSVNSPYLSSSFFFF